MFLVHSSGVSMIEHPDYPLPNRKLRSQSGYGKDQKHTLLTRVASRVFGRLLPKLDKLPCVRALVHSRKPRDLAASIAKPMRDSLVVDVTF